MITRPTWITESTATLIDNIFTNRLNSQHGGTIQGIILTDIADHYPIFHNYNNIKYKQTDIKISRRSYSNKNKNKQLLDIIARTEWANIFTTINTLEAFKLFHNKLKELHDRCFPLQTISKTYNTRNISLLILYELLLKWKIFNNYRPVSVLCSLSKVFEGVMYNRVIDYLNKYKMLFSYQFGFCKCHSTYMSLMVLMDNSIMVMVKYLIWANEMACFRSCDRY